MGMIDDILTTQSNDIFVPVTTVSPLSSSDTTTSNASADDEDFEFSEPMVFDLVRAMKVRVAVRIDMMQCL